MMREMMEKCCGEGGMPDLDKMKVFMERCSKAEFTDDEVKIMRQFCSHSGKPDAKKMKQFMEDCSCLIEHE